MDETESVEAPKLSAEVEHQLLQLLSYFKPNQSDPTYLVLKAHLLAEDLMYEYLQSAMAYPDRLEDARLGFAQLVALCRAHHRFRSENWWGWQALLKLNSLRNKLAHNLEPLNLEDKIEDFTQFVTTSVIKKVNKEAEMEFLKLAGGGDPTFMRSLFALHVAITVTLGSDALKKNLK